MWATVMYNLRVVNAYVQGHSWVSYGVGYLAQTIACNILTGERGGISDQ